MSVFSPPACPLGHLQAVGSMNDSEISSIEEKAGKNWNKLELKRAAWKAALF
ncbi:hypothetical cytosolic protein [Syntrophus aciditrophicus SB]|uniref:Hypothetical cytosolic protein n=1 Tax=Syntrophus aciditrophicus (strain SB) TaxID=56780 RepID=Q2LRH8_SYNAS|nr:hypothetical cytosolic protein [Syntrophus aciditrophicus SB]